jgi:hypothetical protein
MSSIGGAMTAPATSLVTTAETLAANIPVPPLQAPAGALGVSIRGNVVITPGASTTSFLIKLRAGLNNTTTAQIGIAEGVTCVAAAANSSASFHFIDVNLPDAQSGWSLTVTQLAATGNGTITQVSYEVDVILP